MDQKVVQYLNKDADSIMDKSIEKLYNSLEKDINLLCDCFNEERLNKKVKNNTDIIIKRINTAMQLIADLNAFAENGTSYLGSGQSFENRNKDIKNATPLEKDG